jgi:nitrogen PTS system EIIA component
MAAHRRRMRKERCFPPGSVITDLHTTDKYDALRELIRRAPVFGELPSRDALARAVVARERLQSTGLGHGVAVAHGRVSGAKDVLVALGIHPAGLEYGSPDGAPVTLLFVIASPRALSIDYLKTLSTLVRCLRNEGLRDSLLEAAATAEIETRLRAAFQGAAIAAATAGRRPVEDPAVVDG